MGGNSRGGISLATLLKESLIASARSGSLKKDPSMEIHESGVGFDRPDINLMLLHHLFGLVSCIKGFGLRVGMSTKLSKNKGQIVKLFFFLNCRSQEVTRGMPKILYSLEDYL